MLSNNEWNVNSQSAATIGIITLVFPHRSNVTDFNRPLLNMSYGLTFDSGKLWVAEQLDSIATRYLSWSARTVAQYVRESISHSQSLKVDTSTSTPLPISSVQDTFVVPDVESWPSSSNELPYQAYKTEGEMESSTSAAAAMSDSGVKLAGDVFQNDLQVWDGLS